MAFFEHGNHGTIQVARCLYWPPPPWLLPSCMIRLSLALSLALPTGTGNPDPLKLVLVCEVGVASLSLTRPSVVVTSVVPASAPRVFSVSRVGTLSFIRCDVPRPGSTNITSMLETGNLNTWFICIQLNKSDLT